MTYKNLPEIVKGWKAHNWDIYFNKDGYHQFSMLERDDIENYYEDFIRPKLEAMEDKTTNYKHKKEKNFLMIPHYIASHGSLSAESKLLFGKIKALSNNKNKFCWASNKSLAEYFNTTDRTIRRWLEELTENGLIKREYKLKEGTHEVESRHIFIVIPKSEQNEDE